MSTNVMVRNLNIEGGNPTDARRLEIVVDGLRLGLCLASGSAEAAHWASWADCIPSVKRRVAETMVTLLSHHPGPSFVGVRECANMLRESQFVVPPWEAVLAGLRPGHEDDENPVEPKHGWQKPAARAVHEQRVARVIWPNLTDPERALQQRPDGVPTSRSTRIDPQPFRVLLCRRLQLPLPFSSRTCRCGRLLDCRGHHRAACAEAGVLGARGFALERAAAQVCREGGGRVSTNVMVRNLNIEGGNPTDARRLEIVVDGLRLGLCLASGSAEAAHWASWADCIPSVKRRVAETMVTLLSHHPGPSFVAVRECANMLRESQFVVPPWEAVLAGLRPGHEDDENPVELKHGWQKPAARAVHEQRVAGVIWPNLTDPERALQQRPDGVPTSRSTRIDPQPFRVLLCRRLQLPLPFSSRTCRCGRLLCRGHHRAACAEAGVLGARGFALERAAAQVCREGGGRVSTNVMVRNLNIEGGNPTDARRLEIVVDGLTIFDGAQLAIDTTMVSPLQWDGTAGQEGGGPQWHSIG